MVGHSHQVVVHQVVVTCALGSYDQDGSGLRLALGVFEGQSPISTIPTQFRRDFGNLDQNTTPTKSRLLDSPNIASDPPDFSGPA